MKNRIKWILIGLLLVVLFITISSLALWYYPKWFKQSSELDAGIVTGLIGIVTLVGTIGVTVAVNTQTQRIALRMNQENQQLQLKIQEMNVNAMMFQARSGIRDEILKQRLTIYSKLCYLSRLSDDLRIDANYLLREHASESEIKNEISDVLSGYENIFKEFDRIYREHYSLLPKDLEIVMTKFKDEFGWLIVEAENEDRISFENKVHDLDELLSLIHNIALHEFQLDEVEKDIASINKNT